jgi:hypothetical protein
MVDMIDFKEIRSDYDRWFAGDPYAILYINKCQYEVMVAEIDKYKAQAEYEHRRRVAAEKMIIEPESFPGEGFLDMTEYKKVYNEWQSIIKEAGE